MYIPAHNKVAYLGDGGTVGSGYPRMNKGWPIDTVTAVTALQRICISPLALEFLC